MFASASPLFLSFNKVRYLVLKEASKPWVRPRREAINDYLRAKRWGKGFAHRGNGLSAIDKHTMARDERVWLRCRTCADESFEHHYERSLDMSPRYTSDGKFVAREWGCKTCGKTRPFIPEDGRDYIAAGILREHIKYRKVGQAEAPKVLAPKKTLEDYYRVRGPPINLRCRKCKESNPNSLFEEKKDDKPRYSKDGQYIGRFWACTVDQKATVWLPVNDTPCVSMEKIWEICQRWNDGYFQ